MGSLTKEQVSIITGTILGDGSLRRKSNTLLEVNHSYKQQDYVFWLYSKLQNISTTVPKIRKSGINRMACRFTTNSIQDLNAFYEAFYSGNTSKSVPKGLVLDGLSLAIWFMDDGSKSRSTVYFNTQQFDLSSQSNLIEALGNLGLLSSLNKDKTYFRIRIKSDCMDRLKELIKPYLLDSFLYKLP